VVRARIVVPLALAALCTVTVAATEAMEGGGARGAAGARPVRTRPMVPADTPVPVPLPPPRFRRVRTPVPVLMYHAIGNPPPGAPYPLLYTAPAAFRAQMRALAAAGYRPVSLDRVWRAWHGRDRLPRKPVVLSFDDGYRGDYTFAAPILARRGWPAVLNLLVANLHRTGWGLRPWMVRHMARTGWRVESHTLTHPNLTTLDPRTLRREVARSRTLLRRRFHQRVAFFCYPAGAFDAAVVAAVRRAGYLGAETELPGLARPGRRFTLRRVRVDGGEAVGDLMASLRGR
jgi:peptidoglycan/xylan/chitin deacetylase (PgdA/CDA1 family)